MRRGIFTGAKCCIGVASLVIATSAVAVQAQVVNGGFESGFTGWNPIGASTVQSTGWDGETAPQGNNFAVMSTDETNGSVAIGALESSLGLAPGKIGSLDTNASGVDGSGIVSLAPLSVTAGQKLTFDYDFGSNEPDPTLLSHNNDYIFFSLDAPTLITDVNTVIAANGFTITPLSNLDFLYETGFQSYSYTVQTTGTYNLSFGVVNDAVENTDSFLLLDDVALSGTTTLSSTPEPGVFALCGGLSLSGLALLRRRNRKSA